MIIYIYIYIYICIYEVIYYPSIALHIVYTYIYTKMCVVSGAYTDMQQTIRGKHLDFNKYSLKGVA